MTHLLTVLRRAYVRACERHPVVGDRLGPEERWISDILMVAVARAELPQLNQGVQRQTVDRRDAQQIMDGFANAWWPRTLALVASVPPLCAETLRVLRDEHAVEVRGARLRSLREKATSRLAAFHTAAGRPPDATERSELSRNLVTAARLANHEVLTERMFVSLLTERYTHQQWTAVNPTAEQIRLGTKTRPPLSDGSCRTKLVGTDRDIFSRYKLYYDQRARSTAHRDLDAAAAAGIEEYLAETDTEQVAFHELRRCAEPYGLRQPGHHAVLPVTLQALSSPPVDDQRVSLPALDPDEANCPVDESATTAAVLAATYVGVYLRSRWQAGIDLDDLEGFVMRRLWNDLHRWERETEAAAPRRWYVSQLKCALTQYPRDRAVIARLAVGSLPSRPPSASRGAPGTQTSTDADVAGQRDLTRSSFVASVTVLPPVPDTLATTSIFTQPEILMQTVFEILSTLDPPLLVTWLQGADRREPEEAIDLVTPICRAKGLDSDATEAVGSIALRVLRSVAP